MKAQAVIFDMDGILFDTERLYQKVWHDMADEMGITLDDKFERTVTGTNGKLLIKNINYYYHTDKGEEVIAECVRRVADRLSREVPIKKGVVDILRFLKDHGIKTAIASSSPRNHIENHVRVAGLTGYFDTVVSGYEVEHGKPDPDIFLLAAKMLGHRNEECIIFEDSFNGVRAGHASGSTTIMIPDLVPPTEEIKNLADAVYADFDEFLPDAGKYIAV